ncbi:MAG: DUF5615 family PIN-like protein [bacterium]|nr:DUF5615 family PIN-like protein [bacterium]
MNKRCYLVDENTTPALVDQLQRRQPTMSVLKVGDEMALPKGTADPDILLWLERNGFSLVTRNRKSMPRHLQEHLVKGHHVPGIFTLKPQAALGDILDDLVFIWEVAEPDEYQDQIVHIPL